jgi:DNA mismatch endonuclease, patch repair protein
MDRSEIMSRVKSKNTKPEWIVRRMVWNAGFRYRLHRTDLPGTPDLVFGPKRKVIFVNGCFWHEHICRKGQLPKTNVDFWAAKITRNKKRDVTNRKKLKKLGWEILTLWECELKGSQTLDKVMSFLTD